MALRDFRENGRDVLSDIGVRIFTEVQRKSARPRISLNIKREADIVRNTVNLPGKMPGEESSGLLEGIPDKDPVELNILSGGLLDEPGSVFARQPDPAQLRALLRGTFNALRPTPPTAQSALPLAGSSRFINGSAPL